MIDRRQFLQTFIAAAASPGLASAASDGDRQALVPDPNELLELPEGFSYRIVSRAGDTMSDGFKVPPAHDGMAAFPGADALTME